VAGCCCCRCRCRRPWLLLLRHWWCRHRVVACGLAGGAGIVVARGAGVVFTCGPAGAAGVVVTRGSCCYWRRRRPWLQLPLASLSPTAATAAGAVVARSRLLLLLLSLPSSRMHNAPSSLPGRGVVVGAEIVAMAKKGTTTPTSTSSLGLPPPATTVLPCGAHRHGRGWSSSSSVVTMSICY
jgi:hypothetical protein